MTVQNPHDHFFRNSFGRVEIARNYLEEYLPATLRRLLDLSEMTLQDGSFIDEEMREHQYVGKSGCVSAFLYCAPFSTRICARG